jgi:hypothetical protein
MDWSTKSVLAQRIFRIPWKIRPRLRRWPISVVLLVLSLSGSWAILIILAVSLYSGKAAGYVARCFGEWSSAYCFYPADCEVGVALLTELMGLPERLLRTTTAILPFNSPTISGYRCRSQQQERSPQYSARLSYYSLAALYSVRSSVGAACNRIGTLSSAFIKL